MPDFVLEQLLEFKTDILLSFFLINPILSKTRMNLFEKIHTILHTIHYYSNALTTFSVIPQHHSRTASTQISEFHFTSDTLHIPHYPALTVRNVSQELPWIPADRLLDEPKWDMTLEWKFSNAQFQSGHTLLAHCLSAMCEAPLTPTGDVTCVDLTLFLPIRSPNSLYRECRRRIRYLKILTNFGKHDNEIGAKIMKRKYFSFFQGFRLVICLPYANVNQSIRCSTLPVPIAEKSVQGFWFFKK